MDYFIHVCACVYFKFQLLESKILMFIDDIHAFKIIIAVYTLRQTLLFLKIVSILSILITIQCYLNEFINKY